MTKEIDFDKLSKAEQRVLIAKDLITRLVAKKIVATQGTYIRSVKGIGLISRSANGDRQLRDELKGKKCKVCEIGGMFLCALDRHNALTVGDARYKVSDGEFQRDYLAQWFLRVDLGRIEAAFESWGSFRMTMPRATPDQRMRAIAKNIIKNNGQFSAAQFEALK